MAIKHLPDCPDRAFCDCWTAGGGRQTPLTDAERIRAGTPPAAERAVRLATIDRVEMNTSAAIGDALAALDRIGQTTQHMGGTVEQTAAKLRQLSQPEAEREGREIPCTTGPDEPPRASRRRRRWWPW